MQRWRMFIFLLGFLSLMGLATAAFAQQTTGFVGLTSSVSSYYNDLIKLMTGDWQEYGEMFTILQSEWFRPIFLAVIIVVPLVFALHYIIIGAKHFDHDGEQILFFSMYNRIVHLLPQYLFPYLLLPDC